MKVTFKCEKCGHELGEVAGLTAGTTTTREKIVRASNQYERAGCPNCSKLTYGPLTEEMVAEALHEAYAEWARSIGSYTWTWATVPTNLRGAWYAKARFVLRLVEEWERLTTARHLMLANPFDTPASIYGKTPHDWLLDLARKP